MIRLSVWLTASFKYGGRSLKASTNLSVEGALRKISLGLDWYKKPIPLEQVEEGVWSANWRFCYPSDDSAWEIIRYNPGTMTTTFEVRERRLSVRQISDSESRPIGPP